MEWVHRIGTSKLAEITHPDKVLDLESGTTKQKLVEYYLAVADHMLPHIADRPLSVVRCPEGVDQPCFFQKHTGYGLPDGVKTVPVPNRKTGETENYLSIDSREGLAGLAQIGVLEVHPWGSRNESLETPDRIIFDLDPDAAIRWKTLAATAKEVRKKLNRVGLKSYLKSTGGKGLHIVAPIRPDHDWTEIKEFAHHLVLEMEQAQPDLYVTKMTKTSRENRIYLDYLRNDRGATAIAPFSPRARQGTPVSLPMLWDELDSTKPSACRVSNFAYWKKRLSHDPWRKMSDVDQQLTDKFLAAG